MWCCTARQCNILYTQQAIEDLGYDTIDPLDYISCVEKQSADVGSSDTDTTTVNTTDAGGVDGGDGLETPDEATPVEVVTAESEVWIASFSSLPQGFSSETAYSLPEVRAQDTITVQDGEGPLYGAHPLGSDQVQQLELAVSAAMVRVPPRLKQHHCSLQ